MFNVDTYKMFLIQITTTKILSEMLMLANSLILLRVLNFQPIVILKINLCVSCINIIFYMTNDQRKT